MARLCSGGIAVFLVFALIGCGDGGSGDDGGNTDSDADTDTDSDTDSDSDSDTDTGTGEEPFGEIVIEQIYISTFSLGEAILIIGPDETSVLIDTANDSNTAAVLEAIERRVGARELDWVVLTHYHGDHIGGFDNLFTPTLANGNDPVSINRGVVSRGLFDIGSDMVDDEDLIELCDVLSSTALASLRFDLCQGPIEMPCGGGGSAPWAADGCPGLLLGDLESPDDDDLGRLSYLKLGGGARLYLFHGNGYLAANGAELHASEGGIAIGHGSTDQENARSLGGAVRWGPFSYSFNGDTGGSSPDMEWFISDHADEIVIQPGGDPLIPDGGHDLTHCSHHGLASSTSQSWVDWLLPNDGQSRNAVVGNTSMYTTSPSQAVLDRVGARVGQGYVWSITLGLAHGEHSRLKVADGAVVTTVETGGVGYEMSTLVGGETIESESYTSTTP